MIDAAKRFTCDRHGQSDLQVIDAGRAIHMNDKHAEIEALRRDKRKGRGMAVYVELPMHRHGTLLKMTTLEVTFNFDLCKTLRVALQR